MTNGTFLAGYEQAIINTANSNNVNACYIVARLIQEQGKTGTVLTSGKVIMVNMLDIIMRLIGCFWKLNRSNIIKWISNSTKIWMDKLRKINKWWN